MKITNTQILINLQSLVDLVTNNLTLLPKEQQERAGFIAEVVQSNLCWNLNDKYYFELFAACLFILQQEQIDGNCGPNFREKCTNRNFI